MAGWVELHTHSNYSFLDGASDVDDLADAAVEQGLDALALTDTNGLYGAVRFANAAKERGLRPIFGAELQLQDMGHIVLIARDRQRDRGYAGKERRRAQTSMTHDTPIPWFWPGLAGYR